VSLAGPREGERDVGKTQRVQKSHCIPSHHVIQSRLLRDRPYQCHPSLSFRPLMDQNSFNSHSTRSTFFSRVYPTPQSSNNPRSHAPTTRPHAQTPSFFGKSHMPHSAGRNSEFHMAGQILQGGDTSASLPPANTEDDSIYVGHKYHRYFSRSIEDKNSRRSYDNVDGAAHVPHPSRLESSLSASRAGMLNGSFLTLEFEFSGKGAGEEHRQCRSSDDLAGDLKQYPGGGERPISSLWYVLTSLT
jgi:hypothetical protein